MCFGCVTLCHQICFVLLCANVCKICQLLLYNVLHIHVFQRHMFHSSKSSLGCPCFCRLAVDMVHENYFMTQFLQKVFGHHPFGNSSRQGKKFCFSRTETYCLLCSWPCCECCISPLHNSATCALARCCLSCPIVVCVHVHEL